MTEQRRNSDAANRQEYEGVCMVFGTDGNAFDSFDYTPEALEDKARDLRDIFGESTTVTIGPSPFVIHHQSWNGCYA